MNNEEQYTSDSFIDKVWNQYESAIHRGRKQRAKRQELYLKTLQESLKMAGKNQKAIQGIYEDTLKRNREYRKGLTNVFNLQNRTEQSGLNDGVEKVTDHSLQSVSTIYNQYGKRIQERTETYLEFVNKRREAWDQITDDYLKNSLSYQKKIAKRIEDNVRSMYRIGS